MNVICLLFAVIVGYVLYSVLEHFHLQKSKEIAQDILTRAQRQIEKRKQEFAQILAAQEEAQKNSQQIILELQQSNDILAEKLALAEKDLEYTSAKLDRQEQKIQQVEQKIQEQKQKNLVLELEHQRLQNLIHQILLERSKSTDEELYQRFLKNYSEQLEAEALQYQENVREYLAANEERIASRILSIAIHRCHFSHWFENSPSSVVIVEPSDKDQILQSEIRLLLEQELGVQLEYEQGSILIVTADGCRREISRQILMHAIEHREWDIPAMKARIALLKEQLEQEILETGKQVCKTLEIELSDDLCRLLGRLKYRTSFGQNVLWHSVEVATLAKLLAYEIGLDPKLAVRAGFLHDIGKAIDHEHEGGHPEIGGEILQQYKELPEIIEGVTGHHEDVHTGTPYATLISAADAISASRPGARRETFEKYIHRLEKLETIAYTIPGVENAYAISAGREIRLIVAPDKVLDQDVPQVANIISKAIEDELHYPGKIKITVIREMKVVEYAR